MSIGRNLSQTTTEPLTCGLTRMWPDFVRESVHSPLCSQLFFKWKSETLCCQKTVHEFPTKIETQNRYLPTISNKLGDTQDNTDCVSLQNKRCRTEFLLKVCEQCGFPTFPIYLKANNIMQEFSDIYMRADLTRPRVSEVVSCVSSLRVKFN